MVFQYAALLDSLTVFDNVAFPFREHKKHMSEQEIQDASSRMLNGLGIDQQGGAHALRAVRRPEQACRPGARAHARAARS